MKKLFAIMLTLALALATLTVPAVAEVVPKGKVKTVVTLSHKGTVTLAVGQTLQLSATATPEAPITWSSSKVKVATVDANGNVTAIAEGSATIKATAGKKSAKVKIKVVDPNKPTKVAIAQGKSVGIAAGQTVQLSASVTPSTYSGGVTWTSSKPAIATVDGNGNVTGVKKGKAKITAKAGKKKASITVNVTGGAEPAKVTGVALSHTGTVTLPVNDTLTLTASIQPAEATGAITWSSSKAAVASVDGNGLVTPHKNGTATITAKCGKKKAKVKVKVVGAEAHEHDWEAVTEQRWVVDKAAWDETVVDKAAWDETVVDKAAWDETVVVKEAWTEKKQVKADWVESYIIGIKCTDCGVVFPLSGQPDSSDGKGWIKDPGGVSPIAKHQEETWHGGYVIMHGSCYHPTEYEDVYHPAETKVVHHDAVTHVVHHDAETHVVHHDAEGHYAEIKVGFKCKTCGAYEAY